MCGKGGFDEPKPCIDDDVWNRSTSAEQQSLVREIDNLRGLAQEANDMAVLKAEKATLQSELAAAREELDFYESDYTLCDCCNCLTQDALDADGHMQCKSCTRIARLEAELERAREAVVKPWADALFFARPLCTMARARELAQERYTREIAHKGEEG